MKSSERSSFQNTRSVHKPRVSSPSAIFIADYRKDQPSPFSSVPWMDLVMFRINTRPVSRNGLGSESGTASISGFRIGFFLRNMTRDLSGSGTFASRQHIKIFSKRYARNYARFRVNLGQSRQCPLHIAEKHTVFLWLWARIWYFPQSISLPKLLEL